MENTQKIKKKYKGPLETACIYLGIINVLNHLQLTDKQIEMLSFMIINGGVLNKEAFVEYFNTTESRAANIIYLLRKTPLVSGNPLTINPSLNKLDVTQPITLNIFIENEAK